jgi:uncharacterized protein (UPF0248 family)
MIPIRDLLSRIRWDPDCRDSKFEIGYWDRVARRIVRVPLDRVQFADGTRLAFDAIEEDGTVHTVPLHRVRAVWRDGAVIWQRPLPPAPAEAGR